MVMDSNFAQPGVYFNLTTGATGTSQTINVHLIGFYR